jgi:GGDEF domain-containing protein
VTTHHTELLREADKALDAAQKPQINLSVNDETYALLEELKKSFAVDSYTAVVKRSLALAGIASRNQRDDHTISILGKDDVRRDIVLNA